MAAVGKSEVAGFAWSVAVGRGWNLGWESEVCVYDGMAEKGGVCTMGWRGVMKA